MAPAASRPFSRAGPPGSHSMTTGREQSVAVSPSGRAATSPPIRETESSGVPALIGGGAVPAGVVVSGAFAAGAAVGAAGVPAAANSRGDSQRMVVVTVTGVSADNLVTLQATAFVVPE